MILVLITNTNSCKIYQYVKSPAKLSLLNAIQHPENKLKSGELVSDRPGHYQGGSGGAGQAARGAFSFPSDPKQIEIDNFARQIAVLLNEERNKNAFDKLIVVAPPHMDGLLMQHLNKHVKGMVTNNIKKDIMHYNDHDLLHFLHENAQFPD